MSSNKIKITDGIDGLSILFYILLLGIGWINIFAAVYDPNSGKGIFDFSLNSTKQIMWIGTSLIWIILILTLHYRLFETFAYLFYGLAIFLLLAVLFLGKEINGSRSWFGVGGFSVQPSEFAKFTVGLALARFFTSPMVKIERTQDQIKAFGIILVPALLILLQGDTGSAMVFGIFILVLYREGLSAWWLVVGIISIVLFVLTLFNAQEYIVVSILFLALVVILFTKKELKSLLPVFAATVIAILYVLSVSYFVHRVLKPHQQNRIMVLVNPAIDPLGAGWNVTQSKIAIGSGGLWGKGFLKGTQTKLDYVPEQSTDFIFCTIGEEHGWKGSLLVIGLFVILLTRLILLAERQKDSFARIYGYSVACILFFHFGVNIGMTIGLFPVIGIPLPFISYGGSSLWAFTILLFIFLRLDSLRGRQLLTR